MQGMSMDDRKKLEQLIEYSTSGNRICPQPKRWDEFWHLLGCPRRLPPFVLSGWAFSTDRGKRTRFGEQLEYASSSGLLEEANNFLRSLGHQEWHTCGGDLDWSYGDALIKECERRQEAVAFAAKVLAPLLSPSRQLFSRDKLPQALILYHSLFDTPDRRSRIDHLREQTEKYANNEEFPLLDGADPEVAKEFRNIGHAKFIERTLAEILCCIEEAGLSVDSGGIEDFVADMFDLLKLQLEASSSSPWPRSARRSPS
jgi:hypothetical protein